MIRTGVSSLAALAMATSVGGCANQNSIFRQNIAVGGAPVVFTTDAKQRHLIVVPGRHAGDDWKVCAEAAPDVFSALSTSAATDFGIGKSGARTDAQAKAALAIAEAAGTIERTQTINLLRESMYRTCERYMSGAIAKQAFVVQAGRDWRAMIAILAIEQLTRVARPPSTLIASGSTSANVQSESEGVRQLIIAQGAEEEAQIAKQNADADLEAASCSTVTDANRAECETKQSAVVKASGALARATHKRETWEVVAKSYAQMTGANSSTGVGTSSPGGSVSPSGPYDLSAVSYTVGNIVQQAFDTDETQLFCIQAMFSDTDQLLKTKCLSYLIAKVDSESKRLFGSEAVQQRTSELSNKILQTREIVAQYFSGMDDANYEKERDSLSTKIGPFCEGLSKNNCIAAAAGGALDPFAEQLAALIFARIHPKGIQ